jgi:hypothetical protein
MVFTGPRFFQSNQPSRGASWEGSEAVEDWDFIEFHSWTDNSPHEIRD